MTRSLKFILLFLLVAGFFFTASEAHAQGPIVHAILFYSPTCPHCHQVMTQDLPLVWADHDGWEEVFYIPAAPGEEDVGPAIFGLFGEQLEMLYINTQSELGSDLYRSAVQELEVPQERLGVPTLVIAETVLVGSREIPELFPGLVEQGLSQGGVDWPGLPGLQDGLDQLQVMPQATESAREVTETPDRVQSTETEPSTRATEPLAVVPDAPIPTVPSQSSALDNLKADPLGNGLSVAVLLAMVSSVLGVITRWRGEFGQREDHDLSAWIPVLTSAGLIVSGYLTFVETTGNEAFCGPVGDCNSVQQSKYALLFGVLPVGVLGVIGYLSIFAVWLAARIGRGQTADYARILLFGMSAFGTLLSIYLTFLEPFVIGATCLWCLSSAILITALFWLSEEPARKAWFHLEF